MPYFTILTILAGATSTFAMPLSSAQDTWTLQDFSRQCATDGGPCAYSYSINVNDGSPATVCQYTITGSIEDPPARKTYQDIYCGDFRIGSTWSGQLGEGQGFQTLSVVRGAQIVYPAYTDAQLEAGAVVKPDQSYQTQALP
ncbi:hypothetical protein Slin14017_G066490 [Septoria linicola]|nr:hypothetical protein Slin14017_G066490 [Septoria linicola]